MKKSTKLLSVLLAILMIFSTMSVMASAYTKEYKTSEAITALNGYNDIDTVTRLSVDVRADMILDWLDNLLAGLNINVPLSILGTLNATSVDNALNSVVEIIGGSTFGFAAGLGMLGDLRDINIDALRTYRRSSTDTGSEYVLYSLFEFLGNSSNVGVIQKVADGTIEFGNIVGQLVGPYESYIRDIPGLIGGLIAPLFERKDDNMDEVNAIAAHTDMDSLVKNFVIGLFTKPQSTTTYKEDADGNCISKHTLPTETDSRRYYYVKEGDAFTCYVYNSATSEYDPEPEKFVKEEELDAEGNGTGKYVYKKSSGESLKYYEDESYWLPSLANSGRAATIMDITTNKPAQMLYDMIPYVFSEMAPVVLNGSVKKKLGELFGAKYIKIGVVDSDAVKALPDSADSFFSEPQGEYLWEWSNYKVINGTHYYRYQDEIFKADMSNANELIDIVNFNYKITGDYLNQFIPAKADSSANTLFSQLNNLIAKAYGDCVNGTALGFKWEAGDNSKIIDNVRGAFTAMLNFNENAADRIFQDKYDEELINIVKAGSGASNEKVVAVLLAFLAKSLMPQLVLPAYNDINSMLEVGAVVVRELATQLIPGNNFDALIYSSYSGTKLAAHSDAEWLDIILTMGSQIGVFYLNNIADLALTDPALGGFQETKKWYASDLTISGQPAWEASVDFIIDWALEDDNGATGAWKIRNLVTTEGLTIDRNTVEDPWVKLNTILTSILPFEEILNVTPTEYDTFLEQAIRGNIVDAVLTLDVNKLVGMFAIPDTSCLRTMGLETALFYVIRMLINDIGRFGDSSKGDVVASSFTNINSVLSKSGLSTLVGTLLPRLSECRVDLVNTVLPFLNWIIGWSTNDQEFKPATVSAPRYSYNGSAVGTLNGSITVTNNSTGMERQYASEGGYAYDSNYEIQITNATASVEGISVSVPAEKIPAGESVQLTLSGNFSVAQPVIYRVYYKIFSAQGKELNKGATYIANAYSYLATTDSDENVMKPEHDPGNMGAKRMAHKQYIFTKNVYDTVKNWTTEFQNFNAVGSPTLTAVSTDTDPVGEASNYFRHATFNEVKAEMPSLDKCNAILSIAKMGTPGNAHLYLIKDGVAASDIPYGYYDMGQIAVKMKRSIYDRSMTDGVVFVYYTDYGLEDLTNTIKGSGVTMDRIDYSMAGAQEAWDEYVAAMTEATALINMPYVASTMVSEWMPKAKASYDRLKVAYDNIQKYFSGADISELLSVYDATVGVNYQNVKFYRYTKYETAQRAADSIIASQTAPVAPEKYIEGANLSAAEIDAVINSESDAYMQSLLTNTVREPDMTAYNEQMSTWKAQPLEDYTVALAAENLQLMYDRVITKATDKTFLNTEISAAQTRAYDANLYTADSYARFEKALADAVAVNGNDAATQQEAFDAKYELLVAQNSLLLKTESCVELGTYTQLNDLITTAENMLANRDDYKLANGSTDEAEVLAAWTQLLTALGYDYTDAQGNAAILYSGSAKDFVASDRRYTNTAKWRTDGKLNTLQVAIDNFEAIAAELPEIIANAGTTGVVDAVHSYLYGVEPGTTDITVAFGATHEGTLRLKAGYDVIGTGAEIELLDSTGAVVATYTVVIFGDVNGDGTVTAADAVTTKVAAYGGSIDNAAQAFASDVNGDGSTTAADAVTTKVAAYGGAITVNPYVG